MSHDDNSEVQRLLAIQTALFRCDDLHARVELKALPRHISGLAFFISLALSLDLGVSFLYFGGTWAAFRALRELFWKWELHHQNIWNWLVVFRFMFIRWLIMLLSASSLWLRAPQIFQEVWMVIMMVFAVDVFLTIFVEARGHAMATITRANLEKEKERLIEETKRVTNTQTSSQKRAYDSSRRQALAAIDRVEDVMLQPYREHQNRTLQKDLEKAELRRKYEKKFDDWNELKGRVKKRLYETMSQLNLSETSENTSKFESDLLDELYLIAAEDVLFHVNMSNMPGTEMVGLGAHDDWILKLLENEVEHMVGVTTLHNSSRGSDDVDSTQAESQSNQVIETIKEISKLRKKGILTEEEFQNKKQELLKRI